MEVDTTFPMHTHCINPNPFVHDINSTRRVTDVPNPRRLGDLFLDVSPSLFEPLARLLVLPPATCGCIAFVAASVDGSTDICLKFKSETRSQHSDSPGGLFGCRSACPRPPSVPRGHHIDSLAWHITLASMGLCRPPSSSKEAEATAAMAMGGVASPTAKAAAAKKGDLKGEGGAEGMMAVARDEEELGAKEARPQSDPLVDVHMEVRMTIEDPSIWRHAA